MRVEVLQETVVYDLDRCPIFRLPEQDIVCFRVTEDDDRTVTLLVVDRAVLLRGGTVRITAADAPLPAWTVIA